MDSALCSDNDYEYEEEFLKYYKFEKCVRTKNCVLFLTRNCLNSAATFISIYIYCKIVSIMKLGNYRYEYV